MADTAIRPKNYTDEMVAQMTAKYEANPSRDTVDALAIEFGKSVRSVIAKLSREGVYIAQPNRRACSKKTRASNHYRRDLRNYHTNTCKGF